jgi:hypothetical protein
MIEEFMSFGKHDAAVQHEHVAEIGRLKNFNLLEGALAVVQVLPDAIPDGR